MSNTPAISSLAALAALIGAAPAQAQAYEPLLEDGESMEIQIDGDLNGDGRPDSAYVIYTETTRELRVSLSYVSEVDIGFEPAEVLPLDPASFGPGAFGIERGVLVFTDLTGGTTATNTTYRFRYDRTGESGQQMRLIGFDTKLYSRTYAHDGFELSWNLLTGDLITRKLVLNTSDGASDERAYIPSAERKTRRRTPTVWLAQSPDPMDLIDELSQP